MNTPQRVLVLGLGVSGQATARYCAGLRATGEFASVTVLDAGDSAALREVAAELTGLGVIVKLGASKLPGSFDVCVVSPGIPPHAPLMLAACAAGGRIISEVEFAFSRSARPWIAVTGTNGKTTTTALIVHLLEAGGIPARAVGNIGPTAIAAVAGERDGEVLVAEVSSFQLAHTDTFHPRVAVLLNLTPDHINWHGSLEAYAAHKARIFANLGSEDVAVIDVDDAGSAPYAAQVASRGVQVVSVSRFKAQGDSATLVDGTLVLETRGGSVRLVSEDELQIRGAHNVSNALAAAAAAHAIGATAASIRAGLRTFMPIEHRLEPLGTVEGVAWFNDSKATNPDAVLKALTAFADSPLLVLLGGRNKGNDFRPLARAVDARAKAAVVFGESRVELAEAFADLGVHVVEAVTLSDAVEAARELSEVGDAVVLSPACASFDEFDSYEHRGQVFKSLVAAMAGESAR